MTPNPSSVPAPPPGMERMRLHYGFNETDNWRHFALGPGRENIRQRLRALDTRVMRIFLYDKGAPDPVTEWPRFAAYVQAVLDVGARPMITFAKFMPPYEDTRNLRTFVARCADVAWGCREQWGEAIRDWYWCIWNEPNNLEIGGGLSFAQYRRIYEEVAGAILHQLEPCLEGRKARIGGPAVDGFQPFWLDWICRLVSEVDNNLVGFASWHRYADWRPAEAATERYGVPPPPVGDAYAALVLAQTPEYESRARAVGRLLAGRDILNFCAELNVLSHPDPRVSSTFNQGLTAAAYYASALVHLMRGGADLEMWWSATDDAGPYGIMDKDGTPYPACLAKQLCVQYVRTGDWVRFPICPDQVPGVDAVVAHGENGRRSGLFVNMTEAPRVLTVADLTDELHDSRTVLRLDRASGNIVQRESFDGTLHLGGCGVAVVTNILAADQTAERAGNRD